MLFVLYCDTMEIEWETEKLKQKAMDLAKRNPVTARHMDAAKSAKDFRDIEPPTNGRAHFLKYDYKGYFSIDLESKTRPGRLICKPTGDFKIQDSQYIKSTITSFKVIKIDKNYHK